jgi:hypothetical protein
MRQLLTHLVILTLALVIVGCGKDEEAPTTPGADDATSAVEEAADGASAGSEIAATCEIGCGACIYKMDGVTGCPTAVMVDGKAILASGEEFDAHANGLCKAAKQAEVEGKVEGDRIVISKITVLKN